MTVVDMSYEPTTEALVVGLANCRWIVAISWPPRKYDFCFIPSSNGRENYDLAIQLGAYCATII
jgi:hypothetical protein